MLLGLLGGAAGLIVASWLTDMLASARLPLDLPIAMGWSLDGTVLRFTAVLSILTGLLFGSIPALHAARFDLTSALKSQDSQNFQLFRRFKVRNLLVIGQIAGSLVMLVMAGLMLQSLKHESQLDPGFKAENLLLIPLHLDLSGYSGPLAQQFNSELLGRIESLPGIHSAGRVLMAPLSLASWGDPAFVPGYDYRPGENKHLNYNMVDRDYFQILNIPFVRGRVFADLQSSEIVINETMARHYWPGQDALGRQIRFEFPNAPLLQVVGGVAPIPVVG